MITPENDNNAYTVCIKRETQRSFCLYKKSPMLLPLMSRICKLWADVKREFSGFGENYLAGEGRHLDSRSFDTAQDRFRGNDPRQRNAGARQLVGQAPPYKACHFDGAKQPKQSLALIVLRLPRPDKSGLAMTRG